MTEDDNKTVISLWLPQRLKSDLKVAAKNTKHSSMNNYAVAILEAAVIKDKEMENVSSVALLQGSKAPKHASQATETTEHRVVSTGNSGSTVTFVERDSDTAV